MNYHVLPSSTPVSTVRVGVRSAPAPFDYTLTKLIFAIGAALAGDVTFDFRVNGVSLFAPGARPTITAGQRSVTVSGLSVVGSLSDILSWDVTALPLGGIPAPVTCTAVLDDGLSVGGSLEVAEADGTPDLTGVTKIVVGNGDLTDLGGGVARLRTAADALASILVSGKLDPALLPALAITDKFVASSDSAMTALAAQQGDVCFRTDVSEVYLLAGTDPTVLSNWVQWLHPAAGGSTLGGDVTGTLVASVVAAIRGIAVKDFGASVFLSDDFADGIFDSTLWARSSSSNVVEQHGRMEILTGSAADYLTWATTHDMTNRYAQFSTITSSGRIWVRMILNGGLDYCEFRVNCDAGTFFAGYHENGTGDVWSYTGSYDATNFKYLRFEYKTSDSKWHLYYSPTSAAGSWTEFGNFSSPSGAGVTACSFLAYGMVIGGDGAVWIDDFSTNLPASGLTLTDGDTLVYKASSARFENVPAAGVLALSGAPSGPPSNALPGTAPMRYDKINHRLYIWNENTSQWDWRAINNS